VSVFAVNRAIVADDYEQVLAALGIPRAYGLTMGTNRANGSRHGLPNFGLSLDKVKCDNSRYFEESIAGLLFPVITNVGHELDIKGLYDNAVPELEFFRHMRNGVAHGNEWNLTGHSPKWPARFNGFDLGPGWEADEANARAMQQHLNGTTVIGGFGYMRVGDALDALAWVKGYLRHLSP
jgi:hypothetical protein